MTLVYEPTGYTYRQELQHCRALNKLKRVQLKEQMLDHPEVPVGLKYKILYDDLRTSRDYAPAAGSTQVAETPVTFSGYDIVVIPKTIEPEQPAVDKPKTE
jgi:hypothetical protein